MGRVVRRSFLLAAGGFWAVGILTLMLWLPAGSTVAAFSNGQGIELPVVVAEDLVAESVMVYEGAFLEDGSDRPAVNIAALMLRNQGDTPILSAEVILEQGSVRLTFQADTIPPGAAVLVLEKDGKRYRKDTFTACYGWAQKGEDRPLIDSRVQVVEQGMATLLVTNPTDRVLTDLRIRHKSYYLDGDFYMGGVTYETRLDRLEPGQTLPVYPYHYAAGYSKVVEVRVGGELR